VILAFSLAIIVFVLGCIFGVMEWPRWRIEARSECEIYAEMKGNGLHYNAGDKGSVYWNSTAAGWIFGLGVFAAVDAAIFAWFLSSRRATPFWVTVHLVAWTIGPPLFLFVENFAIFPAYGRASMVETMRHGQEMASALWVGTATLLFALAKRNKYLES
jgi:hypothetical protein